MPQDIRPFPVLTAQALALAEARLEAGDLAAARAACQEILGRDPRCAAALHLLGLLAHRAGDLLGAIGLLGQAIAIDDAVAAFQANLCEICRQAGRLDEALDAGRRALAIAPDYPQALNNLGIVHFERGEYAAASDLYRRVIALAPRYAEAHNNLGNSLRTERKFDEALAAYEQALALRPVYADALNNLGTTLRDLGRTREAQVAYRKAHALEPLNVQVLGNLALAVKDLDRLDEAATIFNRVHLLDPGNVTALTRLAQIRLDQDRFDEAEDACRRALAIRADDPETLCALGLVAFRRGELTPALALFRRALAGEPDLAEAHTNVGNILKEQGLIAEARAAHERAVQLDPRQAGFYLNLADGRTFTKDDDPILIQMRALERDIDTLAPTSAMHLHFALAKAHDDLGRHRRSFEHLERAARIKRARITYDEPATLGMFDRIRASFDSARMAKIGPGGDPSDLPIFVIGMPRSGTTLVEQIIASHPLAHGAGELADLAASVAGMDQAAGSSLVFPERAAQWNREERRRLGGVYVERLRRHSKTARRITDKMPANFMFAGLIHLALPNARIIHVVRDPMDTCLSCFSKLFAAEQNHTYDLAELGRYYCKYAELMAHWRAVLPAGRMLEVRYEDVVTDLEGSARRLIDHCGLAWDERCLAFHRTERPIRTASAHQVRRPIYATSQGRWRAYAAQLGPLAAELGELGA